MRTVLIRLVLGCAGWMSFAMVGYAQSVLDGYVSQGLKDNLVLKQRNVSLEKATIALRSAKSLYLPSVTLQGGYQTADGGRNIPLPIGDLLNPVYQTLNQLTGSAAFPSIENETINFLPRNYYDAHIRTTVPIINTDIRHNRGIQEHQVTLSELELDTYKRELIKEIKISYYNYLSALNALVIHESALQLAQEGKRTNEKLVEHGKALPAYVLRSQREVAEGEAKLAGARARLENARLYFNSLLNRDPAAGIDSSFDAEHALAKITLELGENRGTTAAREELSSLETVVAMRETVVKMDRQYVVPKLHAFLDLGSQSEGFHFNDQTRYYMLGLQLEFPIFNGNRNRYKVQQARLDVANARLRHQEVTRQLDVARDVAFHNLESSWKSYESSKTQLVAATAYQRLIEKGYQAGANSYIETVDARNQYTAASLAVIINMYQVFSASVSLEREEASYQLNQ